MMTTPGIARNCSPGVPLVTKDAFVGAVGVLIVVE
jgi:hypothetical protein